MRGDVETYFQDGRWHNEVQGSDQVSSTHLTKKDATTNGREMAIVHAVDHIVRDRDGTISDHDVSPAAATPTLLSPAEDRPGRACRVEQYAESLILKRSRKAWAQNSLRPGRLNRST
jgi:hypothetical protein